MISAPKRAGPQGAVKVKETYPAILGESLLSGRPCFIIRLAGCNLRCSYCDTAYAYEGGRSMKKDTLIKRAREHGHEVVLVTGGEPLMQPDTIPLLAELARAGFLPVLETNGSMDISRVPGKVHLVMDIKTPGSGSAEANMWENLAGKRQPDEIKMVLSDREDYAWARREIKRRRLDERFQVTLSPVHGGLIPAELARWIMGDRLDVRLGLQIHKYIFGAKQRRT